MGSAEMRAGSTSEQQPLQRRQVGDGLPASLLDEPGVVFRGMEDLELMWPATLGSRTQSSSSLALYRCRNPHGGHYAIVHHGSVGTKLGGDRSVLLPNPEIGVQALTKWHPEAA